MARPTDDPKTERVDLRFPPRTLAAIDEWRRHEDDIPARAEAIRRLLEIGLSADGYRTALKAVLQFLEQGRPQQAEGIARDFLQYPRNANGE